MNNRLKFDIGFEKDPDNGVGATREESASWGWLKITVDEVNLCQHVANSQVSDRIHWYLLPLLEWFVENWDSLLHETKLPPSFVDAISARQGFRNFNPYKGNEDEKTTVSSEETVVFDWSERHSLRTAAQGGILPDLFFRRSRNEIEVSWGHTRVQGAPSDLRFLAPAEEALLDPRETAKCLYKAIRDAVVDLCEKVPNSPRLSVLYENLTALNEPRSIQRAAWIAGIGASIQDSEALLDKLSQQYRELVVPPNEELVIGRAPAAVLMFGSLSPDVNEHDVEALLVLLRDTVGDITNRLQLPQIKHDESEASAWEQGYVLADLSRKTMGVSETPYKVALDELLSRSGVEKKEVHLSDTKVRAIAICGQGFRPLIAVNTSCKHNESEPGLRFTLAHELCHLLFDKEEGVSLAVASGPWAPATLEKRANAFAAMFLMPADSCRRLLNKYGKSEKLNQNMISDISAAFGTGKLATLRHLSNLELIDNEEVSVIEEELIN